MPALMKKPHIENGKHPSIELQILGPSVNKLKLQKAIQSYGYRIVSESIPLEEAFPDMNAATALLAAREREGWTQQQLAEKSGLSKHIISSIENGKKIPDKALAKALAKLFQLDYRLFLHPNQV